MAGIDPISLMIAATVFQSVGQIRQGQAAQVAADREASIFEMKAKQELSAGSIEEDRQRRLSRAMLGKQRAIISEQGGGDGGSALDLYLQNSRNLELDALMIRHNSKLRAKGLSMSAETSRETGKMRKQEANIKAFGSALSGSAKALSLSGGG